MLGKLPGLPPQGYFNIWPDILRSAREIAAQEPGPMTVLPSPQAIAILEQGSAVARELELYRNSDSLVPVAPE